MYTEAIKSNLNDNSFGNISNTYTKTDLHTNETMASEETETILIAILLLVIVLFWVGVCHLLLTTECGNKDNNEKDLETATEYLSKDNLLGNLNLPQSGSESLGHIYENQLSEEHLPCNLQKLN